MPVHAHLGVSVGACGAVSEWLRVAHYSRGNCAALTIRRSLLFGSRKTMAASAVSRSRYPATSAILLAMRFAADFTGSLAKCAYRAVVWT